MHLCPAFYVATTAIKLPGHCGLLPASGPFTPGSALASAPLASLASSRLLGGLPGPAVFGLGALAGALIVAVIRVWLWWRAPRRPARIATLPASAPVSTATGGLAAA